MGLARVEGDEALRARLRTLYRTGVGEWHVELHNVLRRRLPDAELFVFDLVAPGVEGDSWLERQAIAVRSPYLHLPAFHLFPKVDPSSFALGGLANRIIAQATATVGTPVDLSRLPEFHSRYLVVADDPEPVRRFFDSRKAVGLAESGNLILRADGDVSVFAEIGPEAWRTDPRRLSRRIDRALEIHALFTA